MKTVDKKRAKLSAGIYGVARTLFGGIHCYIRNVQCESYRPKSEPFLLLSNHTGELDPTFAVIALKRYMRFVMSDHLFRTYPVMKIVAGLAYPIVLHRGGDKDDVVNQVKDSIANGISVALFPEANGISPAGYTGFIPERTGKLVKEMSGSLITMRVVGGGLRRPRWSRNSRKGVKRFSVVNEYSRAELDGMDESEIIEAIRRDLFVDEYEEQRIKPEEYRGEALCEHLERVLFLCPFCKREGLYSEGDRLLCGRCGHAVSMDRYGFFTGAPEGLDNPGAWERWQRAEWKSFIERAAEGEMITEDSGQILKSVTAGRAELLDGNCHIALYRDRLAIDGEQVKTEMFLKDIEHMTAVRRDDLIISCGGNLYEVSSAKPRSAFKYLSAYYILTGREYR